MVTSSFDDDFKKEFSKLKDTGFKEKVKKQIAKIIENPELGKPRRYNLKGTREVYISPYRLSYNYNEELDKIILLTICSVGTKFPNI